MSKAIQGVAMLGAAVGMGVAAFFDPALVASPLFDKVWASMVLGAAGAFAGAIGDALTSNRGMGITSRQVAAYRQIVYGPQRLGGTIIYRSTTGGSLDTYNTIIVIASHVVEAITGIYLDGRKVYFGGTGAGYGVRNGVAFGGWADGNDHIAPDGSTYNFGGNVYVAPRYGDQQPSDVIGEMTTNDGTWAAGADGRSPWVGGCAYVYLHVRRDPALFPGEPEVRFDVLGKNDILDPRTGQRGYTSNWALVVSDLIAQPRPFGVGGTINTAQLIAAANLCEEQVDLAGGGTESRWLCGWHYDTGTAPGDVLQALMPVAAGRISFVGGEWYIYPGAWQGTEFEFDESDLTGPLKEDPYLKRRDLCNRMGGTFIAPNWPYNPDYGNLYDQNGWYNGTRQNTFALQWQPTSVPAYARDTRHGYGSDIDLEADGGDLLNMDMDLRPCLSIGQAQRALKIAYMRKRLGQYHGTYPMHLRAWRMMPNTAFGFTFRALGQPRRVLEVSDFRFSVQPPPGRAGERGGQVPAFLLEASVQETSPLIYEWDPTEELTVYNVAAMSQINSPYVIAPPAAMTLTSANSTGNNSGLGGNSTNWAIALQVTMPGDASVTAVQIQAKLHSAGIWFEAGSPAAPPYVAVGPQVPLVAYVYGVNKDQAYDVRVRSVRSNGGVSAWLEQDNYTV